METRYRALLAAPLGKEITPAEETDPFSVVFGDMRGAAKETKDGLASVYGSFWQEILLIMHEISQWTAHSHVLLIDKFLDAPVQEPLMLANKKIIESSSIYLGKERTARMKAIRELFVSVIKEPIPGDRRVLAAAALATALAVVQEDILITELVTRLTTPYREIQAFYLRPSHLENILQ